MGSQLYAAKSFVRVEVNIEAEVEVEVDIVLDSISKRGLRLLSQGRLFNQDMNLRRKKMK
jgi:hypothetical protein